MPVPALKGIAKKGHKSLKTVEKIWKNTKLPKKSKKVKEPYAYKMAVVKKKAGVSNVLNKIESYLDKQIKSLSAYDEKK